MDKTQRIVTRANLTSQMIDFVIWRHFETYKCTKQYAFFLKTLKEMIIPFRTDFEVILSTEPFPAGQTKGNWSHVEVDLNSLKRLEKERRTTKPSWVVTSTWVTKYCGGHGRERWKDFLCESFQFDSKKEKFRSFTAAHRVASSINQLKTLPLCLLSIFFISVYMYFKHM